MTKKIEIETKLIIELDIPLVVKWFKTLTDKELSQFLILADHDGKLWQIIKPSLINYVDNYPNSLEDLRKRPKLNHQPESA